MQLKREMTLDSTELFYAITEYINNHANGINKSDVCNYEIIKNDDPGKTIVLVQLTTVDPTE